MGVVGMVAILEGVEGWIGRGAGRGRVIIIVCYLGTCFLHVSLYCNMGSYSVACEAKRSEAGSYSTSSYRARRPRMPAYCYLPVRRYAAYLVCRLFVRPAWGPLCATLSPLA
jgi:hypothetical protein